MLFQWQLKMCISVKKDSKVNNAQQFSGWKDNFRQLHRYSAKGEYVDTLFLLLKQGKFNQIFLSHTHTHARAESLAPSQRRYPLWDIEIRLLLIFSPWRTRRTPRPRPVCRDEAAPRSNHSSGLSPHEIPLHQIYSICVSLFQAIKRVCVCRVKWDHRK